jgi:glycosyltransferase involved in cell wall biosynthesis
VRITLVTAVLNRRAFIRDALESAVSQNFPDLEHVVIDGGSTDGTLEIIQSFPHVTWISEPDVNLYDAWNKGVARATGGVVGILNSDDILLPNALNNIANLAFANPDAGMLVGGAEVEDWGGDGTNVRRIDDPAILALRASNLIAGTPYTNARFIRRAVYGRVGTYDVRFPLSADSDFLMRCLMKGVKAATTREPVYRFRTHPSSLTMAEPNRGSLRVATHVHDMVLQRLAENNDRETDAMLRRWHSWSSPYLAALTARAGDWRKASTLVAGAMLRDPILPVRLLPIALRHIAERQKRHGTQTAPR